VAGRTIWIDDEKRPLARREILFWEKDFGKLAEKGNVLLRGPLASESPKRRKFGEKRTWICSFLSRETT